MHCFRKISCFLALCSILFCGSVETHFKKAPNKSPIHSMRGIDFIYLINLDERPEKLALCHEQLYRHAVFPYRFSAVNGWRLSLEAINDVGVVFEPWMDGSFYGTYYDSLEPQHDPQHRVGKNYFCHCMSRGAIGIVLSHLSILQDAYDAGFETIWVMEDDIAVIRSPNILSDMVERLDALTNREWDILFTDKDTKAQDGTYVPCLAFAKRPNFTPPDPLIFQLRQEISPEFRRVGARYGAYSMIVRRSGMKKILDFIKQHKIYLPFDMDFTLPPGILLYTVCHDVVSTLPKALSDNGAEGYLSRPSVPAQ
jgi:GR25 family glycosyltransferase involved in LPS biosynthesis